MPLRLNTINFFCHLFIFAGTLFFFTNCSSFPRSARHTDVLRDPDKLQKDVDFVSHKLEKFHGKLDWYISLQEFEHKMDSLKSTIHDPMTSMDFFKKLSPVVSSLRQGHTQLFPLISPKLYKLLNNVEKGFGSPLAYFKFEIEDDQLYITGFNKNYPGISPGAQVVTIDGISPSSLLPEYSKTFASDGFNTTYKRHWLSTFFTAYYTMYGGKTDSIPCQLKYRDTISNYCLKLIPSNEKPQKDSIQDEKNKVSTTNTPSVKKVPRWKEGNLKFEGADSSIAILTIKSFGGRNSYSFIKYCFETIKEVHTRQLVIDLRDNPGGDASLAARLYSYLVPPSGPFCDTMQVARKTSLMRTPYYVGQPLWAKIYLTLLLPFRIGYQIADYCKVKKGPGDSFHVNFDISRPMKPNPLQFTGPLYVIINGGTFSASCLLSANLKALDRAVFVGEETGGEYNGAVAGSFSVHQLPSSKLKIKYGLALVQPHYKTEMDGRGIVPNIEIIPTIKDHVNGNDPELNWILSRIQSLQQNE